MSQRKDSAGRPSRMPKASLKKNLKRSLIQGHPWLYDDAVSLPSNVQPGSVVAIFEGNVQLGWGYADPLSPIRVRVLERRSEIQVDKDWLLGRIKEAAERRLRDPRLAATNAIRWVHGEGDGLPGLVIDGYDGVMICIFDGEGAAQFYSPHLGGLARAMSDVGIEVKSVHARQRSRSRKWIGALPPKRVEVYESEAIFVVDLQLGQKTGLFLDQRDNRSLVGQHCGGATLLNLFSYTGGFSIAAALGGAQRATSVDISASAMENARVNAERSGVDASQHQWIAEDAFVVLEELKRKGQFFDIVVCDPPSFVANEKSRVKGIAAYRRLNTLAMERVVHGGKFFSASCSSHVSEKDLMAVVAHAASHLRRRATVFDLRGASSDHPLNPAFPEGRYLSFIACHLD